ncbi:MAG: pyridoxamine 5'-phosphate oxidase family protein, partial [Myxococcota bacterium]
MTTIELPAASADIANDEGKTRLFAQPKLLEVLADEMAPKFLATRNERGVPNVVPVTSLTASRGEPGLLHFGNFLLRKTVVNLERDERVAVLVMNAQLQGWAMTGVFGGFEREGVHAEAQRSARMLRYNAYTGIRNAGLVRVRAVERTFHISKARLLSDY